MQYITKTWQLISGRNKTHVVVSVTFAVLMHLVSVLLRNGIITDSDTKDMYGTAQEAFITAEKDNN